jgi:uncharacterized protein (TIGR02001 family)
MLLTMLSSPPGKRAEIGGPALMKKLIGLALMAGAATIGTAGVANAGEGSVSASVAMTTDYVFRGLSQTDGGPAVQGSFDYTNGIFYAGAWASNVDFNVDENFELDLYVGITPTTGPVSWDISLVGYFYPDSTDAFGEYDYFEGIVAASINPTEQFTLGGQVGYSPDYFGETGTGVYYEVNGAFAFTEAFAVYAAWGNQDVEDTGEYSTYNVGLTHAMHGFELDLRYHDTDISGVDDIVNFTISREL